MIRRVSSANLLRMPVGERVPDWPWPYPEGADFVVLRDTGGNLFCVVDHD